jgi:hypothetical protein
MYNVMILKNDKKRVAYVRTNKKPMSLNSLEYLKSKYLASTKSAENNTLTSFIKDNFSDLTQEVIELDTDDLAVAESVKEEAIADMIQLRYALANVNLSRTGGDNSSNTVKRLYKHRKKVYQVLTDERLADKVFSELRNKYDIDSLAKKFSREVVLQARKTLTVNEFELRFFNVA